MYEELIDLLSNSEYMSFEAKASYLIANDVVPVVRCKDCKHCEPAINSFGEKIMECQNNNGIWRKVKPDDFCSYGERREGE